MRGGRCKVHGEGARRVFKPRRVTIKGVDGSKTTTVESGDVISVKEGER